MKVEKAKVADVFDAPTFDALIAEYATEALIDGLPGPKPMLEVYRKLEDSGVAHVFTATEEGRLVGFISFLIHVLPHSGGTIAISESFFVAKAHRHTGAGLKLLSMAEAYAEIFGACGLLVTAPFEGKLFDVLPRLGYREVSRVFFKKTAARHDA